MEFSNCLGITILTDGNTGHRRGITLMKTVTCTPKKGQNWREMFSIVPVETYLVS